MTIKPLSGWAKYILSRRNNPKKVLGRVKDDSVEKISKELREKFGIDPANTSEQAVTDWGIAREETGADDFNSLNYHGGHDLSGLTPAQLLEFANSGTLPPPSTRGPK